MALEIQNQIIKKYLEEPDITEIIIPEGIREIGRNAFFKCSILKKITLPKSMYRVESLAFNQCGMLSCIELKRNIHNVSSISVTACPNLRSIIYCGTEIPLAEIRPSDYGQAFQMIAEKYFYNTPKMHQGFVWYVFYTNPDDLHVMIYIGKNFERLFRLLLEMKQPKILKKFLKCGKFLLEKNIDDFIQYANQVQNYEAQIILTEYKRDTFGFQDIAEKLKL